MIKNLSALLAKPQRSPAAAGAIVAAMCWHLALGHSWPRGLPWKQQQPTGTHYPLETQDPLQCDPLCLLALGHSTPDRRARRGVTFHTTAEANQQLTSQTSKKTDQHEKGTVFCQLSPALSTCSSTGKEDRR